LENRKPQSGIEACLRDIVKEGYFCINYDIIHSKNNQGDLMLNIFN